MDDAARCEGHQRIWLGSLDDDEVLHGVRRSVRPDLARWVAREVTGPGERAVAVSMVLRTETLQAPDEPAGEEGRRANATKVLYQENLAGQQ